RLGHAEAPEPGRSFVLIGVLLRAFLMAAAAGAALLGAGSRDPSHQILRAWYADGPDGPVVVVEATGKPPSRTIRTKDRTRTSTGRSTRVAAPTGDDSARCRSRRGRRRRVCAREPDVALSWA